MGTAMLEVGILTCVILIGVSGQSKTSDHDP